MDPIRGLPPGPRMPRALQTAIWSRQAQWFLEQSRARFGPVFSLKIAYEGNWVMVSDPELVKQVFTGDPRVFHAGEGNQILRPILGDNSVLVLDEKKHIGQRKLLLPPFHGERMQAYGEKMTEIAAREIESWPTGVPYKLRPRMQAITLEIVLETVFGVHGGERMGPLRDALRDFLDLTTDPKVLLPVLTIGPDRINRIPAFRRRVEKVDGLIAAEIAERRRAEDLSEREDVLSLLLLARHEDGSPMSDRELRDELVTLLVAGHETTAPALAWTVERLIRTEGGWDRLGAGGEAYAEAAGKEALRLRPVLPVVLRHLQRDMTIAGHDLPAGTVVACCIQLVHRRPEIYPEPARFLPERFLGPEPQGGTYTWIPFGGGVRRCIGAAFAMMELKIILAEMAGALELAPARAEMEATSRRTITLVPKRGAEVLVGPGVGGAVS